MSKKSDSDKVSIHEHKPAKRTNFALIGGIIGVVAICIYIVTAVFPTKLLSQVQDDMPVEQLPAPVNYHPVVPASPLKKSSEKLFANTDEVFGRLFRQMGKKYTKPALQLFNDTITAGGCGYVRVATGPFYCQQDKAIYIDLAFFTDLQKRFASASDLSQAYIIAHQAGHHIQYLLGITAKLELAKGTLTPPAYQKLVDKQELQADYYAGVWAHYAFKNPIDHIDITIAVTAATQTSTDLEQKPDRIQPDPFNHSTISERTKWFSRGYDTGSLKQGDAVFEKGDLD
ncbi:MAG TPA: neutral zinc metallopeptidase [Mucilaginibacter sp.]|nr:neutral zinc metallopeptidase [Mucilaginibacter sp.]